ncbi:MAG: prephenate dehydrogenase/arogenate dehydrogenase family protein [Deferribacteres bacterium]|nr:prephenate dehydrogenase/arogenate dehydrogenase family protein [Deferribacteres bacterium]
MKVSIVGFGLIGGSIALNLKSKLQNVEIVGIDPEKKNLDFGVERGFLDVPRGTIGEEVRGSDFVVIATHLNAYKSVAGELIGHLEGSELVMDVGSVKGFVVREVAPIFAERGLSFVPAHPIAGTEKQGAQNAVLGLFEGARCIITPCNNGEEELRRAEYFWGILGSKVEYLDPFEHDAIFSQVSHIPHLIAYALVDYVVEEEGGRAVDYAGGGFRDFTRIAASSAEMWSTIFELNRDNVIEDLERFMELLNVYKRAIRKGNWQELKERLEKASRIRANMKFSF